MYSIHNSLLEVKKMIPIKQPTNTELDHFIPAIHLNSVSKPNSKQRQRKSLSHSIVEFKSSHTVSGQVFFIRRRIQIKHDSRI